MKRDELTAFSANHSLSIRDLTTLVRVEDIVNTEHMTTLAVIVPKPSQEEWMLNYEKLALFVVNALATKHLLSSLYNSQKRSVQISRVLSKIENVAIFL